MLSFRACLAAGLWLALACAAPVNAQTEAAGKQRNLLISARVITWPAGVIPWKYNPAGQPATQDTAGWVALLTRTMGKWERACAVRFDYQGTTTTPTFVDDGQNVIGWNAAWTSYGAANSYARSGNRVQPEDVVLKAPTDLLTNEFWTRLVKFDEVMEGVLLHELGHLLGLQHSDQPASVLYANPYHPEQGYMRTLKPDDRAGCAALYGVRNDTVDESPVRGAVQLGAGETARVVVAERVLSAAETATEPSVAAISRAATAVTFAGYVNGMPTGKTMRVELIAPDGSLYDYRNYPSFRQGRLAIFGENWATGYGAAALPGRWTVNVLMDNTLKATQAVDIPFLRGSLVSAYPEVVMLARPGGGGSSATLSSQVLAGGVTGYTWALNGIPDSENTSLSVPLSSAATEVQLRARSNQPRYVTASNNFPQGEGPDVYRRLLLTNTSLGGATQFTGEVLGARTMLTVRANAWVAASGAQNIYVVGIAGGVNYQRTPSGWKPWDGVSAITPYFSVAGPVLAQFAIFEGQDLSGLPPDVSLFVGAGSSFADMLQARRYARVAGF